MSEHSIVSGEADLCWAQVSFSLSPVKWGRGGSLTQLPQERPDCVTSVAEIIKGEQRETFNKI